MPSRAWPDSARAIMSSALKVRISASDSSIVLSSAAPVLGFVLGEPQGLLAAVAQPGQRRLEIMGDIVGHLLEAAHERLDALEHGIEVVGEPIELVAGAGDRQAPGQVAVHDLARRVRHRVDALEHPPRHEQAAGDPEHDDDRQRPAAGGDHDVVQPLALLEVAPDQQTEAGRQLKHPDQGLMLARRRDRRGGDRRFRSSRTSRERRSPASRHCRRAPRPRGWSRGRGSSPAAATAHRRRRRGGGCRPGGTARPGR